MRKALKQSIDKSWFQTNMSLHCLRKMDRRYTETFQWCMVRMVLQSFICKKCVLKLTLNETLLLTGMILMYEKVAGIAQMMASIHMSVAIRIVNRVALRLPPAGKKQLDRMIFILLRYWWYSDERKFSTFFFFFHCYRRGASAWDEQWRKIYPQTMLSEWKRILR